MINDSAREHACVESCCPGQFGAPTPEAGISFSARTGLTLLDLRGNPQDPVFLASACAAFGAALPLAPNTTAAADNCEMLWLGPDEWLLVRRAPAPVNENFVIEHGFLTDVSHGRAGLQISGPRTLDLLAKGCSLDLHPRAFGVGRCAQTALAHTGVLLHLRESGRFEIYCARSYAQHLWHWLTEAAAEYGYEVTTAIA